MSITDELRKLITDPLLGYASQDQHIEMLTKIADHIDAEYQKILNERDNEQFNAPMDVRDSTVENLIHDTILQCVGHFPEYWDEPIAECAAKLQLKEN